MPIFGGASLPADIQLQGASFYSRSGVVRNVRYGCLSNHDYVVFDWETNTGDISSMQTVAAIKISSPQKPATWLSRSSGLQLERVGDWVFAHEPDRSVETESIPSFLKDVLELISYATEFPQNA
jgi:hypothetical protein